MVAPYVPKISDSQDTSHFDRQKESKLPKSKDNIYSLVGVVLKAPHTPIFLKATSMLRKAASVNSWIIFLSHLY
uniref:Uncharacterized protein n=1 Tax=Megaselia scalaris TaxID=36166 RepID=T1GBU1_MEGSC